MSKTLSAIVPCATPFDDEMRLDEAALRQQLQRMRDAGVVVYVIGPGTGEYNSLTPDERNRVMEIAHEELKGRVPVRAMGCEPRLTSEMIDFVQRAERAKMDGAQVYSLDLGHAAKPTLVEMERYYHDVLSSTSLPIYLSSHHAVGYNVPIELVEKLADRYPHLAGMAYGGPDLNYLAQLIRRMGDRLEIHCAGVYNAMTVLALGGNGFMGVEGNFAPQLFAKVLKDFQNLDMPALQSSFDKLLGLWALVARYGGSSGRGLKPMMNAFGMPGGSLRLPRVAIDDATLGDMIQAVLSLQISGIPKLKRETRV